MNSQPAAEPSPANSDTAPVPSLGSPSGLQLNCGYGTDRGLRREMNEDSFIASDPVFAVADGMGGHEAGEIASGICVRTLAGMPQLASGGAGRHRRRRAAVPADGRRRHPRGHGLPRRHHALRRCGGGADGCPVLAGPEHRRLPDLPAQPGQAQPGQRGPLRGPGTGGRRADHARPRPPCTRAGTSSPAPSAPATRPRPTTGCCPSRRATGSWSAPTGSTANSTTSTSPTSCAPGRTRRRPWMNSSRRPCAAAAGTTSPASCVDATNVASDYDGAAQTAPRSAAAAEDEDTLPRTDALDLAPNGEVVSGAGPAAEEPAAAEPRCRRTRQGPE